MAARTVGSSTSTMRAPSVPTYWSVACTSCPPGADTAPATWPASYSAGIAHVEQIERALLRLGAQARQRRAIDARDAEAVRHARGRRLAPRPASSGDTAGAPAGPCRSRRYGRRACSPWCRCAAPPPCSARPALISDCAPMMLRVRPAQLTTTSVSGEGARSRTRSASSAPGTLIGGRDRDALDIRRTAGCRAPPCRCRSRISAVELVGDDARRVAGRARRIRRTPCSER